MPQAHQGLAPGLCTPWLRNLQEILLQTPSTLWPAELCSALGSFTQHWGCGHTKLRPLSRPSDPSHLSEVRNKLLQEPFKAPSSLWTDAV